jgi:acyl carrier protein
MTDAEIRALILELIGEIAPEADPAAVGDQDDIRDVFDLDSMDFTNLIIAIHERIKVNIPEADYNRLFTIENAVAYLRKSLVRSEPKEA